MRRGGKRGIVGIVVLAVLVLGALAGPAPGPAAAADESTAVLERVVRRLQDAQSRDGGFPLRAGGASDPVTSLWVALAVASGGVHPADQRVRGERSLAQYVDGIAGQLTAPGDLARLALVAAAEGRSPRAAAGGVDAIALLQARQADDGSFPRTAGGTARIEDTALAIVALSLVDGDEPRAAAQRGVSWLVAQQRSGGWPAVPGGSSSTTATGAALEALAIANVEDRTGIERAVTRLRGLRDRATGGFPEIAGSRVDPVATGRALQGLWAIGQEPRDWTTSSGSGPFDLLVARQRSGVGSVRRTAQATIALAGLSLPLAAVPRGSSTDGDGPTTEDGVTSGGGGDGTSAVRSTTTTSSSPASSAADAAGTTGGGTQRDGRGTATTGRSAQRTEGRTTRAGAAATDAEAPATTTGADAATGDSVTGQVVGEQAAASGAEASEPAAGGGLRSADEGRGPAQLLAAVLAVMALAGVALEARRPRRGSPVGTP